MGVSAIFELDTPYTEDELFDIGYEQANDVMILTHLNHPPQRLARYGHTVWQLSNAIFGTQVAAPPTLGVAQTIGQTTDIFPRNYSYRVTAIDPVTGEESLPSPMASIATNDLSLRGNFNTLTIGAVAGVTKYNIYKAYTDSFGWIGTAGTGRSFIDDNILPQFQNSFPGSANPFTGTTNYPAVVTFFEQRAFYARTLSRPNAFYGSQSSLFFNMNVSSPVQASDAITVGLAARRSNAIMHMVPMKELLVFTTDAVWSVKGTGGFLAPDSVNITPQGYRGCSRVRPVTIDQVVLFNTSRGATIRTINYAFDIDGYKGNDLTVFCPHLFRRVKVVDMAWAEYPTQTVYVVCDDGKVRALTWQQEQQVWGWSLIETDGQIESVCVISEGGEDVAYFVVKRRVGITPPAVARDVRYVERASSYLYDDYRTASYLDSSRSYDGEPAQVFGNLTHLEGCQVVALADGAVIRDRDIGHPLVVTGGQITLPRPASKVVIGLPYDAWIRTLPIQPPGSKGKPQTMGNLIVSVVESRGGEYALAKDAPRGTDELAVTSDMEIDQVFPFKGRPLATPPGQAPKLFTGDLEVDMPSGDWRHPSIIIRQRDPLPIQITSIAPDVVITQ